MFLSQGESACESRARPWLQGVTDDSLIIDSDVLEFTAESMIMDIGIN